MKIRILTTLVALLTTCVGNAYAENLSMADVTLNAGATKTVVLSLPQSDTGVAGFQFDISIPEELRLVADNQDDPFTLDAYLMENFSVNIRRQADGSYRLMAYSPSVSMVPLRGDESVTFKLKADKEAKAETIAISAKNIVSSDINGIVAKQPDVSANITIAPPVKVVADDICCCYGDGYGELSYVVSSCYTEGTPGISCVASSSSPAGSYNIVVEKGTLETDTVTLVNGTLTITKAPLSVMVGTYARKVGEKNPEFIVSYSGFKNDETEAVLSKLPIATTKATKDSEPGEYEIVISGGEAANYDFSYTNGKLIVTEADAVVIIANDYTREYGEDNPTFEYTSSGAELDGIPLVSCEATATSPVGTYPIVIKKGSVTNYNDTYVNGTLTITKAPLTVKAGTYTRKQGEENPEFTLSYSGFKNDETATVLTKKPITTTTATKTSESGEYEVTVSGGEAQNYELSYTNGKLIVMEADPVVVTANNYTREYGDDNPFFEFSSSGAMLVGTPEITCEATATSPIGTYPIIIKKGGVANYNDTYVNGTLTITKAPLTISVGTYTKRQYESMPEITLSYSGFKNNETKTVLTTQPTIRCDATENSEPGVYTIMVNGAAALNYDLAYVDGKLIVTEPETYTLTYLVDGEVYKTVTLKQNESITPEELPTKEGYTFSGWSEIPELMPAHDVTVTGSFSINKYKLIYKVDGAEYKTIEIEYGATITPEVEPFKEGYTFSGWSWIPSKMPAENVTITGTFTINKYKLTYMIGNEVYKVVEYEYGATIKTEPQPDGDYYSFEWLGLPETMPANDVTVYASYVTGIQYVNRQKKGQHIYNYKGMSQEELKKGLNIVVRSNGVIKKYIVK